MQALVAAALSSVIPSPRACEACTRGQDGTHAPFNLLLFAVSRVGAGKIAGGVCIPLRPHLCGAVAWVPADSRSRPDGRSQRRDDARGSACVPPLRSQPSVGMTLAVARNGHGRYCVDRMKITIESNAGAFEFECARHRAGALRRPRAGPGAALRVRHRHLRHLPRPHRCRRRARGVERGAGLRQAQARQGRHPDVPGAPDRRLHLARAGQPRPPCQSRDGAGAPHGPHRQRAPAGARRARFRPRAVGADDVRRRPVRGAGGGRSGGRARLLDGEFRIAPPGGSSWW